MKSIVLRLMLVLAAFGIVPSALAADGGNAFVDATYGETVSGAATNQSGWGADGGYLWKVDDESSVGFEVGYMHFGHVVDNSNPMGFFSSEASASAMTLGAHYQYLFSADKASIFQARAGLMNVKFDGSASTFFPGQPATTVPESSHQSGRYFGVGIGRYITPHLGVILRKRKGVRS